MLLFITIYSHRVRTRPRNPRMVDRRAVYLRDYRAAAEKSNYAPAPSSAVAPTQRDPYEQLPQAVSYSFWAPDASGRVRPSGVYVGTNADAANPAWAYGGRRYCEPLTGVDAVDSYSGTH